MEDGSVGSPCGACREYMMQLDKDSGEIEILIDLEELKTVRLKELIPDWWGREMFKGRSNMLIKPYEDRYRDDLWEILFLN